MVALGVFSVVSLGLANFISQSVSTMSILEEKLLVIEFEKDLIVLSGGNDICSKYFTDNVAAATFSTASFPPSDISIGYLYANNTDPAPFASPNLKISPVSSLAIDDIKLTSISGSAPNYSANLIVSFKDGKMSRKQIETAIILGTELSGANTVLKGCKTVSGQFSIVKSPLTSFYYEYSPPYTTGNWKIVDTTTQCPLGTIVLSCLACMDSAGTCLPDVLSIVALEFWSDSGNSQLDVTIMKVDDRTCKISMGMAMSPLDPASPVYLAYSGKHFRLQADCILK